MRVERRAVLVPAVSPVPGQAGVVGGCRALDHDVAADRRPGMLDQAGPGVLVTEDPPVFPVGVELPEIPGRDPAPALVRVRVPRPLPGELPHVVPQRGECAAGHLAPVVGRPAPDDGVERDDDRQRVGAAHRAHFLREPLPVPPDGRLGRLDQQLAVTIAADVPAEEVETLSEADDPRLVLVQRQPPLGQPPGELRLDLPGLLPGAAAGGEVVSVPDQGRRVLLHQGGVAVLVADPGGLLKAVQRDVQ